MDSYILFEQPLTERIRTFLRLEWLFKQTKQAATGDSFWDSRNALHSLIEILNVFERGDLKSEVLKELERQTSMLGRLTETPGVDVSKCHLILAKLQSHTDKLQAMSGRLGHNLKHIELINTVKQRLAIPGGTCNFDAPTYHFWQEQPASMRKACLDEWGKEFALLEDAISLLLELTRSSTSFSHAYAENGFYQQALEPNNPCQLVRLTVSRQYNVLAEISGGRHRISIRFLELPNWAERPTQTQQSIEFQLACCMS